MNKSADLDASPKKKICILLLVSEVTIVTITGGGCEQVYVTHSFIHSSKEAVHSTSAFDYITHDAMPMLMSTPR
jgi:hypothetical protein